MLPYRNDLEALEARHAALEAEVADKVRRRDEAARMLEEARAQQRAANIAADFAAGGPARRQRQMVAVVLGSIAFLIALGAVMRVIHRGDDRARRMERVMTQFERYTDEICACKDKDCATAVTDRMTKWAGEIAKDMTPDDAKPDAAAMERMTKVGQRMSDCMTKAMMMDPSMRPYGTQEGGYGNNSNANNEQQLERE